MYIKVSGQILLLLLAIVGHSRLVRESVALAICSSIIRLFPFLLSRSSRSSLKITGFTAHCARPLILCMYRLTFEAIGSCYRSKHLLIWWTWQLALYLFTKYIGFNSNSGQIAYGMSTAQLPDEATIYPLADQTERYKLYILTSITWEYTCRPGCTLPIYFL